MMVERPINLDPRTRQAVEELEDLIRGHFPDAIFTVSRAQDDPQGLHLTTVVDADDPDVVLDVVMDRLLELQTDDDLPISVIPLRTPARAALLRQRVGGRPQVQGGAALPV